MAALPRLRVCGCWTFSLGRWGASLIASLRGCCVTWSHSLALSFFLWRLLSHSRTHRKSDILKSLPMFPSKSSTVSASHWVLNGVLVYFVVWVVLTPLLRISWRYKRECTSGVFSLISWSLYLLWWPHVTQRRLLSYGIAVPVVSMHETCLMAFLWCYISAWHYQLPNAGQPARWNKLICHSVEYCWSP